MRGGGPTPGSLPAAEFKSQRGGSETQAPARRSQGRTGDPSRARTAPRTLRGVQQLPGQRPSSAWVLADLCPTPSGETTGTETSQGFRGVSWEHRPRNSPQEEE